MSPKSNSDTDNPIITDPGLEPSSTDTREMGEGEDSLGPRVDTSAEESNYLLKVAQWVNSIEEITRAVGLAWDIRPDMYDSELEPLYISDIVSMNQLLAKALRYWRVHISQTGPEVYAITLEPIKAQIRGLMSGGKSPEEAIVNVIYRYLTEVGTKRLTK